MSFVRAGARAQLWRWREVLAGAAVLALGLYWVLVPGRLLGWIGGLAVLVGLALIAVGAQRARFRAGTGGPGVVQVDEGRITYFGPLTGGSVAVSELERLVLDPTALPAHWVLHQPGRPPLHIPVTAEGAETLFDTFSALPGLRTGRMLAELGGRARQPVVIWERQALRRPEYRLH